MRNVLRTRGSEVRILPGAPIKSTTYRVHMYGGLARRPEVTPDGFTLVVCHEVGHHFGGYPFVRDAYWAANDGQADYFSTLACARRLWQNQPADNALAR